jgi:hypothetical protein
MARSSFRTVECMVNRSGTGGARLFWAREAIERKQIEIGRM